MNHKIPNSAASPAAATNTNPVELDRWRQEILFEEDMRAVLLMLRPNRKERLKGWSEYRTGGADFRVTVSWSQELEQVPERATWQIPKITAVLEATLIGSVCNPDEISPQEEFERYRQVIRALAARIDELESCYT